MAWTKNNWPADSHEIKVLQSLSTRPSMVFGLKEIMSAVLNLDEHEYVDCTHIAVRGLGGRERIRASITGNGRKYLASLNL